MEKIKSIYIKEVCLSVCLFVCSDLEAKLLDGSQPNLAWATHWYLWVTSIYNNLSNCFACRSTRGGKRKGRGGGGGGGGGCLKEISQQQQQNRRKQQQVFLKYIICNSRFRIFLSSPPRNPHRLPPPPVHLRNRPRLCRNRLQRGGGWRRTQGTIR